MPAPRQLQLGALMRPAMTHTVWRDPGAVPDATFNRGLLKRLIQRLAAAKFDAFLIADHLAVRGKVAKVFPELAGSTIARAVMRSRTNPCPSGGVTR